MQAIQVRKELTDEGDARGVQKGIEYAILTDEISRAWSGMSTRQYKNLKGLKKENLRDNMTTLELVLNMLAEATTAEISKQKVPETLSENIVVARAGGKVAGDARKAIEAQTGVPVITDQNASQLGQIVANILEETSSGNQDENSDKLHKSARVCHLHGLFPPFRRRFSATLSGLLATQTIFLNNERGTSKNTVTTFKEVHRNDGLQENSYASKYGVQPTRNRTQ